MENLTELKNKCTEILSKSLLICFDMDDYRLLAGEVYMAFRLGLITQEEREIWLDKAAENMRKANEEKRRA